MGAEAWSCIVPYQADIEAAMRFAQEQEFAAGRYRIMDSNDPPSTIDEACLKCEASGTCSILDMMGVIDTPHEVEDEQYLGSDYGMVAPLSPDRLVELYGTERPTRPMVLGDSEIYSWLDRGIGSYVVVYEGETPTEIFFAGYSFD